MVRFTAKCSEIFNKQGVLFAQKFDAPTSRNIKERPRFLVEIGSIYRKMYSEIFKEEAEMPVLKK